MKKSSVPGATPRCKSGVLRQQIHNAGVVNPVEKAGCEKDETIKNAIVDGCSGTG
jgi:hypothetical protein